MKELGRSGTKMTLEQIVKDLEKQGYIVKTIFPILPNSFGYNDDFENLIDVNF